MTKAYRVKDKYFQRAKREGYRARSAYKLKGIQQKFKLLKPGQVVVDLGSAPGSFLQVISEIVGPQGRVLGIDLQEIEALDTPNVTLLQGDIRNVKGLVKVLGQLGLENVDVVTSDLAPSTSGIKDLDQSLSLELTAAASETAMQILKNGGHFVGKVFQSNELESYMKRLKQHFRKVVTYKPQAVRDRSVETYVIAIGFKADTIEA